MATAMWDEPAAAEAVERGCGTREQGGIYAELGLSGDGVPVEHFLIDPQEALTPAKLAALGIKPIGVSLFEDPRQHGVWHVFDWIGSSHYTNVADFVEEVRRFGLSRRFPRTLDFSKLSPQSRLLTIHANAYLANADEYQAALAKAGLPPRCVKGRADHAAAGYTGVCASLWWQDVFGGEAALLRGLNPPAGTTAPQAAFLARRVRRQMPSFDYTAYSAPEGVTGRYAPAVFASWPMSRVVVIKDRGNPERDADGMNRAGQGKLPVRLEDA